MFCTVVYFGYLELKGAVLWLTNQELAAVLSKYKRHEWCQLISHREKGQQHNISLCKLGDEVTVEVDSNNDYLNYVVISSHGEIGYLSQSVEKKYEIIKFRNEEHLVIITRLAHSQNGLYYVDISICHNDDLIGMVPKTIPLTMTDKFEGMQDNIHRCNVGDYVRIEESKAGHHKYWAVSNYGPIGYLKTTDLWEYVPSVIEHGYVATIKELIEYSARSAIILVTPTGDTL